MITAVDSSILLDVFTADPGFGPRSREALREAMEEGKLIACDIVWAEVAGFFGSSREAEAAFETLGVEFSAMTLAASLTAGKYWMKYRKSGGTRARIISDFLIGAHALTIADRLLSRDRGFYRRYFSGLKLIDPTPGSRRLEKLK